MGLWQRLRLERLPIRQGPILLAKSAVQVCLVASVLIKDRTELRQLCWVVAAVHLLNDWPPVIPLGLRHRRRRRSGWHPSPRCGRPAPHRCLRLRRSRLHQWRDYSRCHPRAMAPWAARLWRDHRQWCHNARTTVAAGHCFPALLKAVGAVSGLAVAMVVTLVAVPFATVPGPSRGPPLCRPPMPTRIPVAPVLPSSPTVAAAAMAPPTSVVRLFAGLIPVPGVPTFVAPLTPTASGTFTGVRRLALALPDRPVLPVLRVQPDNTPGVALVHVQVVVATSEAPVTEPLHI
mmetsp:Transcript_62239/g.200658  ORF Transcript_62239/g.200658 Transcript_62239/m.200658 type:complete len:290 (-) Transcript_62239:216-1085(-)